MSKSITGYNIQLTEDHLSKDIPPPNDGQVYSGYDLEGNHYMWIVDKWVKVDTSAWSYPDLTLVPDDYLVSHLMSKGYTVVK